MLEPLVSTQWFVKTKPLAAKAIEVVENGRIEIIPENWTKTYYEWMYNIRDWCISRQLWWGHRIPAWHCQDCAEIVVARETPDVCPRCGSTRLEQDPDVLDTWFSSGLWPFSTLGWPDQTPDLAVFYPTSLLITGFDILFFWVARMIMMGMECMGDVPFRQVYIHALVRDAERQKMSKTRGNTVDPLEVTEKYGTDAVRMTLLTGAAPGTDIVLTEERMESSRAFANKIWNAARFLFMNMERSGVEPWLPESQNIEAPERCGQSPGRAAGRPLDLQPVEPHGRAGESRDRAIPLPRGCPDPVAVLLARVLRLVPGDEETPVPRELRNQRRLAQPAECVRAGPAHAASGDAVPHRGIVAAAGQGSSPPVRSPSRWRSIRSTRARRRTWRRSGKSICCRK